MKTLVKTLILISALLTLSACQGKDEYKDPKLDAWQNGKITGRTVGGKEIPTAYIFDCRKITDAKNVHYYYSLIADPKGVESRNENGEKVITYNDANFNIDYHSVNYGKNKSNSLLKGLFSLNVDFKVIERHEGFSEAIVTANETTVINIKYYYKKSPYLNQVKAGDELFRLRHDLFQQSSTNLTEYDMPGTTNGESLECR